jgi:hypothetical protein
MPFELLRTSSLKAPRATILVYAPPRWGKTHLARTCPKPLVISTEAGSTGGLMTLSDLDLPAVRVRSWDEMVQLIATLRKTPGRVELDGEIFETVFIDSLGPGCGELWMQAGMKIMGWKDVWGVEKGKDPRRVYSYISEKGQQAMKLFLSLDAHLVMTSRVTILEESVGFDDKGNEIKVQYEVPDLPGQQLPKKLTGETDATLYGEFRGATRVFRTKNQGKRVSGIRAPGGTPIPDPILANITDVIALMMGDMTAVKRLEVPKPGTSGRATTATTSTTRGQGEA